MEVERPLATATFPDGMCGIYSIRHTTTGRRYIGQSKNLRRRMCEHRYDARRGKTRSALQRAFQESSLDEFVVQLITTCSQNELDDQERLAIESFETTDPANGFNLRTGGLSGDSFNGEWKERNARINRDKSPQWLASIAAANRARFPVFQWHNEALGITEFANQTELAAKYDMLSGTVSAVARGRFRQHKGWRCVAGPFTRNEVGAS